MTACQHPRHLITHDGTRICCACGRSLRPGPFVASAESDR